MEIREELRHKHRKTPEFTKVIIPCLDELCEVGLLICDKDPRKKRSKDGPDVVAAGGRIRVALDLRKPKLEDLGEQAEAERKRLDVGTTHFP